MRKIIISLAALMLVSNASAFSLTDAVSTVTSATSSSSSSSTVASVVSTVASVILGDTAVTAESITGTWKYSNPAVQLNSDSALTEAAGTLVTSQIETKLSSVFTKVGITSGALTFTFNSDMSFSCATSSRTLSGTYTIDETEKITLNFSAFSTINLGSISAMAYISSSNLSLLFTADKLLDIVSAVASVSNNSTLQTINTVASSYDGAMLGFEFSK